MQIFLPHKSVYLTALVMQTHDPRRFNKQIIECRQIIKAIRGLEVGEKRPWCNHPIVQMYKNDVEFLVQYLLTFYNLSKGHDDLAKYSSELADELYPEFLKNTDWYFENMRKRLYTKSPEKYDQYEELGNSYSNFYYVDGEWKEYKQ